MVTTRACARFSSMCRRRRYGRHRSGLPSEETTMTNLKTSGFALLLLVGAASCDTKVSNPGPVQDDFLLNEQGRTGMNALVNGAGRAVASGMNWGGYPGAAVTREIHPAGSTGSFGITALWQN